MKVIESMIPHGGWHYPQEMGGRKHRVEGSTYAELEKNLLHWRLENSIPVGDVVGDIQRYICDNFPNNCQRNVTFASSPAPKIKIEFGPGQRFIDKLTAWGVTTSRIELGRLESEAEAARRGAICQQCQHNKKWEDNCPPCVEKAQRLFVLIRQARELTLVHGLHACDKHNFCIKTAVWIASKHLRPNDGAPKTCWLTK